MSALQALCLQHLRLLERACDLIMVNVDKHNISDSGGNGGDDGEDADRHSCR